ncbi:MAG: bifunctional demethylmenaquinone methyltransferase/2-methoxy-6-polyprenyl-1,4-benzoquinol methylase UbiE [Bacteroidetes bacterium]|nr:bifunctional demethylmenaquinone methyltransferase/2-methoxy-6-polyprenyl-1,4-benzoquinol methylase UbiE [Bacteroidota bacterium]
MSEEIRSMFADISDRYDAGNDILSFGTHRLWKQRMVRMARAPKGGSVLDLATGTGDIALLFSNSVGGSGHVLGVDFCASMIDHARARVNNQRPNLAFEVGDAMNLRFNDDSYDVTTISFGIRNVDDPVRALSEMHRVTRPGGRVVVMEFGQPRGVFGSLYRFYSSKILPFIGGLVLRNRSAYDYLNRTAAAFPCRDEFTALMHAAGFRHARWTSLFGGIAFIYVGDVE